MQNQPKQMEKIVLATEQNMRDQVSKQNKKDLTRQYILLKHVPALLMELLTKTTELTFVVQDMCKEIFAKVVDIAVNSAV